MMNTTHSLSSLPLVDTTSSLQHEPKIFSNTTPIVSLKDLRLTLPKRKRLTLSDDDEDSEFSFSKRKTGSFLKLEKVAGNLPFSSSSDEDESDSENEFSSLASSALSELVSDAKSAKHRASLVTSTPVASIKTTEDSIRPQDAVKALPRPLFHHPKENADDPLGPPVRSSPNLNGLILGLTRTNQTRRKSFDGKSSFVAHEKFGPLHRPLSELELDVLSQGTDKIEELLNDESWWQEESTLA
jgi:hypothetical protein